jgi:hypothetical protein
MDPVSVATELAIRINSINIFPNESPEKLSTFLQRAKELENTHPALLPRLAGRLMETMLYFSKGDALRSGFATMVNLAQSFMQDPSRTASAIEIFSTIPAMLPNLPLEDRTEVFVSLKGIMNQQLSKLKEEYSTSLAANIHSMLVYLAGAVNVLCPSVRDGLQKELSGSIKEYANIPADISEDRFAPLLRKGKIENAARSYNVMLNNMSSSEHGNHE